MGRADISVVRFARIQVVIHSIDASHFESIRLIVVKQAQTGADLQVIFFLNFGNDGFHGFHFSLVRPSSRDDDTISFGLLFCGQLCAFQQLISAQNVVLRNLGRRDLGLRTVVTVLRTKAAFRVHQEIELNGLPEVLPADSEGGSKNFQKIVVRGRKDGHRLILGQGIAGEDLIGQRIP